MKRLGRMAWCRGFGPAIAILAVWVWSIFTWNLFQFAGGSDPLRMVIGRGVVAADWGRRTSSASGLGTVQWELGIMIDESGRPLPGAWFMHVPAMPWQWPDLDAELQSGHLKIPLIYPALAATAAAGIAAWLRARRPPPWACKACGYDLRGSAGGSCPECGKAVVRTTVG